MIKTSFTCKTISCFQDNLIWSIITYLHSYWTNYWTSCKIWLGNLILCARLLSGVNRDLTDLDFDFALWGLVQFTVCLVSVLLYVALQQWCKGHSLLAQTVYKLSNKTSIIIIFVFICSWPVIKLQLPGNIEI